MSVFQKLKNLNNKSVQKKPAHELTPGRKYQITKMDVSFHEQNGRGVRAFVKESEFSTYFVYLPAKFSNLKSSNEALTDEDVAEINQLIEKKEIPHLVYYGKDSAANIVDILPPGCDLDHDKLSKYSPKKVSGSTSQSKSFFSKRLHLDSTGTIEEDSDGFDDTEPSPSKKKKSK